MNLILNENYNKITTHSPNLTLQSIALHIMRKLGILIILVLVLTAIFLFNLKQPKSTLNPIEKDFAIADTALVDKIYIADKGDKQVLLQRKQNNEWIVNDKYKVRKGAIDLLLETIKRIRPKNPVANAAHNNVVRNMAGNAKKVEIYQKGNDEPVKTYYIGGTNLEKNANYMLLDDAEQPYAVHIPGFTGYISGRYILKEIDWRDRTIFALRPEKIKSIKLQYPMEKEKGFQLNVVDNQNFALQSLTGNNAKPIQLKPAAALNYLQAFRFLACEAYLNEYTRTDSLLRQKKKNILTVELNDGSEQQLDLYYIPVNKRSKTQFDEAGDRVPYDVDRYYATFNNNKEIILIQEYVFGKVLNTFDEMKQLAVNQTQNKKPVSAANKNTDANKEMDKSQLEKIKQEKSANKNRTKKTSPTKKPKPTINKNASNNKTDQIQQKKPQQRKPINQTQNKKLNLNKKDGQSQPIKPKTNRTNDSKPSKPKPKTNQ